MTSFRRHVPNRFLINQCQIITFLTLKYDIIENSRIELRGIVLPVQVGGLLGGPKGMLAPPLSNYWGDLAPPPPPWPPLFLRLCWRLMSEMSKSKLQQFCHKLYFCLQKKNTCISSICSCAKFQNECLKTLRGVDYTILLPLTET